MFKYVTSDMSASSGSWSVSAPLMLAWNLSKNWKKFPRKTGSIGFGLMVHLPQCARTAKTSTRKSSTKPGKTSISWIWKADVRRSSISICAASFAFISGCLFFIWTLVHGFFTVMICLVRSLRPAQARAPGTFPVAASDTARALLQRGDCSQKTMRCCNAYRACVSKVSNLVLSCATTPSRITPLTSAPPPTCRKRCTTAVP
mmetsp:Transcript_138503/g.386362  ORF Transcript_138503/g.386362 Transcript_138503/m.386362 type:complete len:202 (+) Transcript_138503:645-1250(+)